MSCLIIVEVYSQSNDEATVGCQAIPASQSLSENLKFLW